MDKTPEEIGIETRTRLDGTKWVSLDDFNKALKAKDEETDKKVEWLEKELIKKRYDSKCTLILIGMVKHLIDKDFKGKRK